MKDNIDTITKDIRYNKNINNKPIKIRKSLGNNDKNNYSIISLLSYMYESNHIDIKNIEKSFKEAKEYINKYEEKWKYEYKYKWYINFW